jgi:hypothetical protein
VVLKSIGILGGGHGFGCFVRRSLGSQFVVVPPWRSSGVDPIRHWKGANCLGFFYIAKLRQGRGVASRRQSHGVTGAAGRCVDPSSAAAVDRESARVLGLGDEPTKWARGSGLFGYYLYYIFHSRYTYINRTENTTKATG